MEGNPTTELMADIEGQLVSVLAMVLFLGLIAYLFYVYVIKTILNPSKGITAKDTAKVISDCNTAPWYDPTCWAYWAFGGSVAAQQAQPARVPDPNNPGQTIPNPALPDVTGIDTTEMSPADAALMGA